MWTATFRTLQRKVGGAEQYWLSWVARWDGLPVMPGSQESDSGFPTWTRFRTPQDAAAAQMTITTLFLAGLDPRDLAKLKTEFEAAGGPPSV